MPVSPMEGSMTRIGFIVAAILALTSVSLLHKNASTALAVGTPMSVAVETMAKPLTAGELKKIERYLRHVLGNPEVRLVSHAPDAEVFLGKQFLGVVFPDDHKEGRTFFFEMVMYPEEIEEFPPQVRGR
jgi:hypothetical protein